MGAAAVGMVGTAMEALARRDLALARKLPELDDHIDALNRGMLAKVLAVADDVRMLEWGSGCMWCHASWSGSATTRSTSASRWPFWSQDNSVSSPTLRIRRLNIRRWWISEMPPKQTSTSHARWPSWRQDWRTEPCPTRGHAGPGLRLLEPERRPLDNDDPHRPDPRHDRALIRSWSVAEVVDGLPAASLAALVVAVAALVRRVAHLSGRPPIGLPVMGKGCPARQACCPAIDREVPGRCGRVRALGAGCWLTAHLRCCPAARRSTPVRHRWSRPAGDPGTWR
jgi:hypothetical protein